MIFLVTWNDCTRSRNSILVLACISCSFSRSRQRSNRRLYCPAISERKNLSTATRARTSIDELPCVLAAFRAATCNSASNFLKSAGSLGRGGAFFAADFRLGLEVHGGA